MNASLPKSSTALAAARRNYPGTSNWTYVDVAARGLISTDTRAAIDGYLDHRMAEGGNKAWMFQQVEKARAAFAALVNAEPDEIALTKNISEGVNAFATAIAWKPGDNVVFCETLEHPANVFPWYNLSRLEGVSIKPVAATNGRIPVERVLEAIDDRTRVVTISSVSFSPGFRFPIKTLTDYCRPRGILVLVDGAQSIGILETDVEGLGIDALAVSTQKGLLALYGMGFLYVRKAVAEMLRPVYLSRLGVRIEGEHEAALADSSNYELATAARRFDVGNFNYIGAIAVENSIQALRAIGVPAVEAHVCALGSKLAKGLFEIGIPVFGGPDCQDRSHIVALGNSLSDQHDATSDDQMLSLHEHLDSSRVKHTIRRGVIRLSLHLYNNDDDVARIVDAAREWRNKQKHWSAGYTAARVIS